MKIAALLIAIGTVALFASAFIDKNIPAFLFGCIGVVLVLDAFYNGH